MASVNISKWDIAQAFGLQYFDYERDKNYVETYIYDFHGLKIRATEDYYNVSDRSTANEYAAEQVLDMIARCAVAKAAVAMSEK